jgi:hypothetical protein
MALRRPGDGLGGAPWDRGRRSWLISRGTVGGQWIFVHDRFACGRRFRILNAGDDVTQECLAAIPAPRSQAGAWRGKSSMIVSDNGTMFTSAQDVRIVWHLIPPEHVEGFGSGSACREPSRSLSPIKYRTFLNFVASFLWGLALRYGFQ